VGLTRSTYSNNLYFITLTTPLAIPSTFTLINDSLDFGRDALQGVEPFSMPSKATLGLLTANGLIGTVVSDYLWARSVLLLSPLISTLGLSLTIPCSMLAQVSFSNAINTCLIRV